MTTRTISRKELVGALDAACEDCKGTGRYILNALDLTPQEGGPEPHYVVCDSLLHQSLTADAIFSALPVEAEPDGCKELGEAYVECQRLLIEAGSRAGADAEHAALLLAAAMKEAGYVYDTDAATTILDYLGAPQEGWYNEPGWGLARLTSKSGQSKERSAA